MTNEFDYFQNPTTSKLVDLVLHLATELHVTTSRLQALEMQLARDGVLPGGLDRFVPHEDEREVLERRREEFLHRLVRIITEDGPAEHPLRGQWETDLRRKVG